MLQGNPIALAASRRTLILLLATAAAASANDERLQLVSSDVEPGDTFGSAVAISGTTGIVGAPQNADLGFWTGSAYLFDTVTGQETFKLTADDAASNTLFGDAVGVSGTYAVVGAHLADSAVPFSGAAYVFDTVTGAQVVKLVADDAEEAAYFGETVAISGTTVLVGAPFHGPPQASGAAYLFDAVTGQQLMRLYPNDNPGTLFAERVSIDGTRAIVSARGAYVNGALTGAAYVFDTTTGLQTAKLVAGDGEDGDQFGLGVAIDGDLAVVGNAVDDDSGPYAGAAYVFDATTGQQRRKLLAADGYEADVLGSVAISGTLVVAGAWRADDNGPDSGCAYLFDALTGQQLAKLLPSDGAATDEFSRYSIGIDGSTIVLGAWLNDGAGSNAGRAYVFDAVAEAVVGTSYCGPAVPNSTGGPGSLTAFGSDVAVDDCIRLQAADLPGGQFALFLTSQTSGLAVPPGSQGNLCLGGSIGRYVQDVQPIGPSGAVSLSLDLASTPTPNGTTPVQAGETWYFQAWHRDANPVQTSNFTDAVSIAFL